MSHPLPVQFRDIDAEALLAAEGRIALLVDPGATLGPAGRRLDRATRGAVARALASEAATKLKPGEARELAFPAGLACEALHLVRLPKRTDTAAARKAGGAIGRTVGEKPVTVVAEAHPRAAEVAFGLVLRAYDFTAHKTAEKKPQGPVRMMVSAPEAVATEAAPLMALAEGVCFTRDLVNEPANVLTTYDFAERLLALRDLGVEVEVLEEEDLAKLGMGALLGVRPMLAGNDCGGDESRQIAKSRENFADDMGRRWRGISPRIGAARGPVFCGVGLYG